MIEIIVGVWVILFICLFVSLILNQILSWYRKKEQNDLKSIGAEILALENNLHYTKDGEAFLTKLKQFGLEPGKQSHIKNILRNDYGVARIRVFEASYIASSGQSHTRVELMGISIESRQLQLPHFILKQTMLLDGSTFDNNLNKIDGHLLPESIRSYFSLFNYEKENSDRVVRLFSDKHKLLKLLIRHYSFEKIYLLLQRKYYAPPKGKEVESLIFSNFHFLAGTKNRLVLYQKGHLKTESLLHFQQLEQKGRDLFEMFRELNPAKKLKISEQDRL